MANVKTAECWSQIERWLSANAPGATSLLPNGASPAAFSEAERKLELALPDEVKEYLSVHDGSAHLWLYDLGEFMQLDDILATWDQECDLWGDGNNDEWAKPQGPIKEKWFSRKWLPVLDARTGDYICVDLDPPSNGKHGQLIDWRHDAGPTKVIASSLGALLSEFVADLSNGLYQAKIDRSGRPFLEYSAKSK